MPSKPLIAVLFTCLVVGSISAVTGRVDPQTGRVRVFHLGTNKMVRTIDLDPLLTLSAIPQSMTWDAWEQDAIAMQRYLRVYFPRSYQQILSSYDVIYSGASTGPVGFQPSWTMWFRDAVVDEGLGFCETGGSGSFGGQKQFPGWIGTEVEEIMPVGLIHSPGEEPCGALSPKIVTMDIRTPGDTFLSSLPMDSVPKAPFQWINQGSIKQGALTPVVRKYFPEWPIYAHIEVGKGLSVGWLPFVYTTGGYFGNFAYWEYFPDFLINFLYFAAGIEMPGDPEQTHRIRTILQEFDADRQFLIDIIEFANMFGANTVKLEGLIADSEKYEMRITELYMEQDYERTWDVAKEGRIYLEDLQHRAMRIKRNSLLWVYVIEWLAVTGTLVISGSVLWTLMVNRRMYREMGGTRFG